MIQIDYKNFFVGLTALIANHSLPEIFQMITPQEFAYYIQSITSLIIAVATLIRIIKIEPKKIKDDSITTPKKKLSLFNKKKSPLNNK
jgi:uncharacterized membrane protein